jgi:predicted alpha/beta hydrolase
MNERAAPGVERLPMPPAHHAAAPLAFWPAAGRGPAALVLPALGVPAGAYRRFAELLAERGTPVGVAEWRGGGTSPVRAARGIDWGYVELLQHEVQGGLGALAARLGARPVVLVGHSLGGHLALMARARALAGQDGLAGVLTVASGTPTLRFFAPRLRRLLRVVLAAHRVSGPLLGYFPGHRIGFGGRQPRTLMDQWALLARRGRFELEGRNLLEPASDAARRIPVHAVCLAHDAYAPRAATAHLLELAGLGPQAIEQGIEAFDGPGPVGHFDWLKAPQAVAARVHELLAGWPPPALPGALTPPAPART